MPGISIIYKKNLNKSLISDSLSDLKHEQNYEAQKLLEGNNFMLAFSGYEGYPKQYSEDASTFILVEGLIYNKNDSEVERLLKAISKSYIENNDYKNSIKEFINDSDGDFVVLIYFKQIGEFIIFNDRWGRLPSYYYRDDDMFIFSRELKFVLNFIPSIEFDKVPMTEFLVFEYTLGDKTLVKNVYRVSPSCVFNLRPSDNMLKIEMEKVFDVNFEESPGTLSKNEYIEKCKELFLQSMNYRVNKIQERKYNITADLSGGYDTRAILGCLCRLNVKVDYYTNRLITGDESEYADKIAALYNKKPVRILASHDMNYSDMSKITYMTDCTVNGWTALACYNDSLERSKQVKDVSVRFMGFGGEFLRHPYKARKYYKKMVDMLRDGYFVGGIKIKHACSIMNLDEETFYNHLTSYFNEYPEPTLRDKVKHLYFEYYNNLVNAGENRHRLHFWTIQPLWSKDLLSFATKCIPTKYIGFNFFTKFLRAIDPNLLNAPIYGSGIKFNPKMSLYIDALKNRLKDIMFSNGHLYKFVKYVYYDIYHKHKIRVKSAHAQERLKRDLLESYANLNTLSSCLDEKGIHKFIQNEYIDFNLYRLMTLILYFREIENRYEYKICSEPCK